MAFWITYYMKAKREQKKKEQIVIKLFSRNYARDIVNAFSDFLIKCLYYLKEYMLALKPKIQFIS